MSDETIITFRASNCRIDPDDAVDPDKQEDIAKFFQSPFPEQMDITVYVKHMMGEYYEQSGSYAQSIVCFDLKDIYGNDIVITPLSLDYDARDFEKERSVSYLICMDTYSLVVFDDGPPYTKDGRISFHGRFNDEFHVELDSKKARILIDMDIAVFGGCPDLDGVGIQCEISRREFHELARRIRESIPEENQTLAIKNHDDYIARCKTYAVYYGGFLADKDQS